MISNVLVAVAATVAGAIAAISGFGIGSILTPLVSLGAGTKTAVAAVSIPHFVGTGLRFWRLRAAIDRRVFWSFGVMSALGGLVGAVLHVWASELALGALFGSLLIFAGATELTGLTKRVQLGRRAAWIAGGLSGLFGGLVGNQGGIRSAALLGFNVRRDAFVATATAAGLAVDVARLPVYLATEAGAVYLIWPVVLIATVGVVLGTIAGTHLLGRLPEKLFRRLVALLIMTLGVYMLARAGS
jgi:uncharacterized membrane protein YfcA